MSDLTLTLGDCIEVMRGLPDASIDAVVCDPPPAFAQWLVDAARLAGVEVTA